jgi:hypothetical protein
MGSEIRLLEFAMSSHDQAMSRSQLRREFPRMLKRIRPDWRRWIGLLWVLWWAWAYALMAIQAKSPQVLAWVRSLTTGR